MPTVRVLPENNARRGSEEPDVVGYLTVKRSSLQRKNKLRDLASNREVIVTSVAKLRSY
jgi:hypothetical protein